jgi:hypothetical protein
MTLADSGGACSVPNGTALSILIPGITNAGAATYPGSSFSVATFVDATPASPASNVVITPAPVPGPPPTTEPGTPTTPTITNLPASGIYGGSFSATVGTNGDGTKSVTSSTMSVCTVSGFVVTYVAIGTCSLTAHVAAGRNYGAADGNAQSFMIGPATCRFSRSGLTEDLKIGTDCWNVSSIETSATGKTEAVQVTSHSLSLLNAMLQDNLTGAHIFPTLDIVNNVGRVVVSESLGPALVDSFTEDAGHSVTGQFSFGFTSPLKDTQTPATGRCSFSGSGLTEDLKISTDLAGKISTDCWNVSSIKTSATGKTEAVQVTSDSLSLLNAMLRENLAGFHIFPELDIVNNVGTVVVSESLGQSLVDSFTEDAGHSVTGQFSFGFTSLQDIPVTAPNAVTPSATCSFSGSGLTEDLKISTDLAGKISTDCWNVSSIKTSATGKTEAVQVTSDSLSLLNAMLRENLAGFHIFPELDIVNNVGTVVVSESLGQSLVDSFTEDAGHSVTGQFSFGFTPLQDAQNISAPEISTMR